MPAWHLPPTLTPRQYLYCYASPCPHTRLPRPTTGTLLPQRHSWDSTQDGSAVDRDTSRRRFVASKGSEVMDPQTPDLLREAGVQLKAWHIFLTLLAHKRVIQGGTQYLTEQQTGQDCILKESGRGRRPLEARLAMSLSLA